MNRIHRRYLATLVVALLAPAASPGAAQTASQAVRPGAVTFPPDIRFVVRVDAGALAESPILAELLRRPEADNGLARALGQPSGLSRLESIYLGLPDAFTPAATELPVLVVGDFGADEIMDELGAASGVRRIRDEGRVMLEASGRLGTAVAAALGDGALAVGDLDSVRRMIEAWKGGSQEAPALPAGDAGDIVGGGAIPSALRDYLQSTPGGAPFAAVDRLSFTSSLGQAVRLQASLHAPTAEGRQGLQQALGALILFGPSRFANDPEVLSAIQSLRFTVGADAVDLSVTLPRSLLLRLL